MVNGKKVPAPITQPLGGGEEPNISVWLQVAKNLLIKTWVSFSCTKDSWLTPEPSQLPGEFGMNDAAPTGGPATVWEYGRSRLYLLDDVKAGVSFCLCNLFSGLSVPCPTIEFNAYSVIKPFSFSSTFVERFSGWREILFYIWSPIPSNVFLQRTGCMHSAPPHNGILYGHDKEPEPFLHFRCWAKVHGIW